MKKLLAIILTLVMIVACFAGCAGGNNDSSVPDSSKADDSSKNDSSSDSTPSGDGLVVSKDGTLPLVADKVDTMTMTIMVGPTDDDPDDMWFFKYYAARTNVDWQVTPILSTDWSEKKAVIMGAGDYTDTYWFRGAAFSNAELLKYGESGIFLDLKNYYDYAPDYVREMDGVEGSWDYVTTPSGANYTLASLDPAAWYSDNGLDLWLKTSLLSDNGFDFTEDYIMTLDELYNVLKTIKDNNPDIIPLTGMTDDTYSGLRSMMLLGFGFDTSGRPNNNIGLLDGNVVYIPTTERYKEYLTYMNKLYSEGLLDQDFYTQDETQLKAKTSEGKTAGWVWAPAFVMDLDHQMEYTSYAVAYNDSTDPIKYQSPNVFGGTFQITDKCEYPELALAWINLFYQPEHEINIMYGPTVYMNQETGEYTIISEGVTDEEEAMKVAIPIIFDKDGNYVDVDVSYWNDNEVDNYSLWDWCAKFKPVNTGFGSTIGEDYAFGKIFQGFPSTVEEIQAQNYADWHKDNLTSQNEGWWRYNNILVNRQWISHGYPSVYLNGEQQEWMDANSTILNDYVYQMEAQFVTGAASIEKDYDAFLAQLEKLGAAEYEKIYIDVYPSK